MGVRREPRLRADFNTRFGVRIFVLPDSNFIQSQKRWVLASLYPQKCMKMQYFHQYGGGVRTPAQPCAGSATGWGKM